MITPPVLNEIAARIVAAAPEGWERARLRWDIRDDGTGSEPTYTFANGESRRVSLDLSDRALDVRRLVYRGQVYLVLEVEATGRFEATVGEPFEHADRNKPILYLCDDEAALPDRGDEQDAPASAVPAGDPEEAVRLFHELMRRRAEIFGHEEHLPPPADDEELQALEEDLGFALPADLRALYRIANGDDTLTTPLFDGNNWITVDNMGDEDDEWAEILLAWEHEPHRKPVLDAVPANTVRRSVLRPGWIRFADDTFGNWLAVDMDPASDGRPGQVICVGVDYREAPRYVADSVTTFLRRLVEALERGDYSCRGDDLHIDADLPQWHEAEKARTLYTDARSLAESASEARPHVQKVSVTDVEDLGILDALPNLRAANLSGRGHPDLTPLRALPVEALELELGSVDLTPLVGHTELRSVMISSKASVELAPLRTLPNLWALDVSTASVADIGTIAELMINPRPNIELALRSGVGKRDPRQGKRDRSHGTKE